MELHRGRLIDHVHLRARDLEASQRFYAAILGVLGIPVVSDDKHLAADELWIDAGEQGSHVHLAFRPAIDRWSTRPGAPDWRREAGTTVRLANGNIIRATTPASSSIPTATTSKWSITAPPSAPPPASS